LPDSGLNQNEIEDKLKKTGKEILQHEVKDSRFVTPIKGLSQTENKISNYS
jgi:hypothetical protein